LQKRKRILLIVGVVCALLLVIGVVMFPKIKQAWEQPLGPELGLVSAEPTSTNPPDTPKPLETDDEAMNTEQPPTPTPEPEYAPRPVSDQCQHTHERGQ